MSHPQAQKSTKPQGAASYGFDRLKPTAWFLCEVVIGWPHPAFAAGRHVYVSRSESGTYRMLGQGDAVMVMSESVAARHLRRCRDSRGDCVRVRDQQHQTDRFNEAMSEARRQTAA